MTKEIKRIKTSWYIDQEVLDALNIVKEVEGTPISRQMEMGAKLYLQRHRELLEEYGKDLWTRR